MTNDDNRGAEFVIKELEMNSKGSFISPAELSTSIIFKKI